MTKRFFSFLIALTFILWACVPAAGADIYWDADPATPGDWFDPANWDLDRLPRDSDNAYINNDGTVQISVSVGEALELALGSQTGDSGTVTQTSGQLHLGTPGYAELGWPWTQGEEGVPGFLGVGCGGTGQFTQNGGTVSSSSSIEIGSGGQGTYTLTNGELEVTGYWALVPVGPYTWDWFPIDPSFSLGTRSGQGTFNHSGGTNNCPFLYIGAMGGSQGTYNLSSTGHLQTSRAWVGQAGSGTVFQTGGTCEVTGHLYLGDSAGATGIYDLMGPGTLSVRGGWNERIGSSGMGTFTHTDGTHTVDWSLYLGYNAGSQGYYTLADSGQLTVNGSEHVGYEGTGTFTQTGGTHTVATLTLGNGSGSVGTYTISEGQLAVGTLQIGIDGAGTLNINHADAAITVSGTLSFGADSTLAAVPGSTIHMTGSAFENYNTDETKLAGLSNLHLIYDGHTGDTDPMEVAGEDMGRDCAGFLDNFALGAITLEYDAILQLVDDFDNLNRGGVGGFDEALYLGKLTLEAGATLDLNGLHLYVGDLDQLGGAILGGDLISLIPGDADGDWCVDGVDLAEWQQNYDPLGLNANTFAMGDWDGDGCIDGGDLALWQQNYDPLGPGLPSVTPEPATLFLLGIGLVSLAAFRRDQCKM